MARVGQILANLATREEHPVGRSRSFNIEVAAILALSAAMSLPALAQPSSARSAKDADLANKQAVTIEGRRLSDWIAGLKDKDPAVRKRALVVLGNVPRGQLGDEMARLQDLVKGLMFGDKDSAVREAATASLLKLSRTPQLQQAVDGPNQMVAETPLRLVDTQGRPVAGAVVSTFFTRDLDRESSFTPSEELSLKPQTSNEQGEATLTLSLWHPKAAKAVYAIRPDMERPLVGLLKVTGEELGKRNTIVMHPACRVRLRVECPAFRELEERYHAELEGPGWERGAFLLMGDQTTDPFPLRAGSTTGELEFLVPPGRYTIIAYRHGYGAGGPAAGRDPAGPSGAEPGGGRGQSLPVRPAGHLPQFLAPGPAGRR